MPRPTGASYALGTPPLEAGDAFKAAGWVVRRPALVDDLPSYLARSELGWCFSWRRRQAEIFATEALATEKLSASGPAFGEGAQVVEVAP